VCKESGPNSGKLIGKHGPLSPCMKNRAHAREATRARHQGAANHNSRCHHKHGGDTSGWGGWPPSLSLSFCLSLGFAHARLTARCGTACHVIKQSKAGMLRVLHDVEPDVGECLSFCTWMCVILWWMDVLLTDSCMHTGTQALCAPAEAERPAQG